MTNVKHNPNARYERLYMRAREVHETVSRLAEDLQDSAEGKSLALSAQDDLSALCLRLEGLAQ